MNDEVLDSADRLRKMMQPPATEPLTGDEPIIGTTANVRDFWAWALSNLRANTVRSMLGEYLVAQAVGASSRQRIEWDSFDVRIPEGRIEVKTSAYLQAWEQVAPSKVVFSGLLAKTWSPSEGFSQTAGFNADAYVFSLVAASAHDLYQALDTEQWQFWVLPASVVSAKGQKSMGLSTVKKLAQEWMGDAEPVQYRNLRPVIMSALHVAVSP